MSFRARAGGVLRWFLSAAKGTLYPLDATGEETALVVGTDGQVLTADSTAPGGMSWQDAAGGCVPEILVDDVSGEILFDDVTGDILYDDTACVGGGSGGGSSEPADLGSVLDLMAGTLYVATTGSDTTGDGSSGAPYATVGKALTMLPRTIAFTQTIAVADGTYAEAVVIDDLVCAGAGKILLTGNPTTPANVTFTGTTTTTIRGRSLSAVLVATGPVAVEVEGLRVNATADAGFFFHSGVRAIVDRCVTAGTLARGIAAWHGSQLEFHGDVTAAGWTAAGVQVAFGSQATYGVAGTLTCTGPGTSGVGLGITGDSALLLLSTDAAGGSCSLVVTGVKYGVTVDFASSFTWQPASGSISITNSSTPTDSAAVHINDTANWSTNKAITVNHFTYAFEAWAMSYAEAISTRTISNVSANSNATQNSVIYLP